MSQGVLGGLVRPLELCAMGRNQIAPHQGWGLGESREAVRLFNSMVPLNLDRPDRPAQSVMVEHPVGNSGLEWPKVRFSPPSTSSKDLIFGQLIGCRNGKTRRCPKAEKSSALCFFQPNIQGDTIASLHGRWVFYSQWLPARPAIPPQRAGTPPSWLRTIRAGFGLQRTE
jgi:hypothetical protein